MLSENQTYFITSATVDRKPLLRSERMAQLVIDTLQHYRHERKFTLHEFVVMPDHFHVLLTVAEDQTLERVVQYIKGGFSHRARKEFGFRGELWQSGYHDRRVRNAIEYAGMRTYIHQNPVQKRLVMQAEDFPFSSATLTLDSPPQRLKPIARTA